MNQAKPHILVIFGASGDLTKRKLIPALFTLFEQKLLPDQFAVLGVARTELSDEDFRTRITEFLPKEPEKQEAARNFLQQIFYQPLATEDSYEYPILRDRLATIAKQNDMAENYIFYLSTPPKLYEIIPANLASVELNKAEDGFRRLIVEKPFGINLESAASIWNQPKS